MLGAAGGKLRKEYILRALDGHAVYYHRAAKLGLPERHIEHMVQSERNERPFQNAVYPGTGVAAFQHELTELRDSRLNRRPDEEHQHPD